MTAIPRAAQDARLRAGDFRRAYFARNAARLFFARS
jgi:hypothetical protein